MDHIVQKVTTDLTFAQNGVLVPAGTVINIDTKRGNFDFSDSPANGEGGNTPNLGDVGEVPINIATPVAAIGPTGPNPTMPQQVGPGAFQTSAGYVQPGGVLLVAEGSQAAADAAGIEQEGTVRRQAAETTGDATTAALGTEGNGFTDADAQELVALRAERDQRVADEADAASLEGFDADGTIDGSIADVTPRLEGLSRAQLNAVKAAEADREVPRVGVTNAVDAALAKLTPTA